MQHNRSGHRHIHKLLAIGSATIGLLIGQPFLGTSLAAGTCDVANDTSGQVYPSSNGASLQQAIDEASAGDRLTISGRCFGGFTIDKSLTLHGGVLDGGGTSTVLQVSYATVNLWQMLITNGYGDPAGGGIINNGGVVDLWHTDVTGSTATQEGGGVYNAGTLTLHQYASIVENSAGISGGGGIFNDHGSVEMFRSSDVSRNRTLNVGGGVENDRGTVIMHRDARVRANSSGNSAGGIYNTGRVKLTDSAAIVRNTAGRNRGGGTACGGAVLNEETGVLVLEDSARLNHNEARSGGAVCNDGYLLPTMLVMKGQSTIKANRAPDGGGIWNFDATVELRASALIRRNTATQDGGGIWDMHGRISMYRSALIEGNVAEGGTPQSPTGIGGGIRRCDTRLSGVVEDVNVLNNRPDDIGECR